MYSHIRGDIWAGDLGHEKKLGTGCGSLSLVKCMISNGRWEARGWEIWSTWEVGQSGQGLGPDWEVSADWFTLHSLCYNNLTFWPTVMEKTLIKLVRDNDNSKLSSVWNNFGGGPTYYESGQFWPVSLFWVTAHKILPLFFGLTPRSLWAHYERADRCLLYNTTITYTDFQVCTACVICCLGTQPVTQSMQNMQRQIVRHDICHIFYTSLYSSI